MRAAQAGPQIPPEMGVLRAGPVFSNAGMSLNGEFEAGSADGSFSG
jgi:hypothetical protein